MNDKFCWIYTTTRNMDEARQIAKALINEKLAACVNIIPGMESVYEWKGEVCTESETAVIIKSAETLFNAVSERIKALHSYDLPCIIKIPVSDTEPRYHKWLSSQLSRHKQTGGPR